MSLLLNLFAFPSSGFLKALRTSPREVPSVDEGIEAGLNWMKAGMDEHVPASGYFMISEALEPPSVEVCSLWLRLLVHLKKDKPDQFLRLFKDQDPVLPIAEWLLARQRNDGTWPSGTKNPFDAPPGIFCAGLAVVALLDFHRETGDPRAAAAIKENVAWLVKMQDPSGAWLHYTGNDAPACTYAGFALASAARTFALDGAREAAVKSMEFALLVLSRNQDVREDVPPFIASSHGWMLLALLENGILLNDIRFGEAAINGMETIILNLDPSGSMNGLSKHRTPRSSPYSIPYANCLVSVLSSKLYKHTSDARYRALAERTLLLARKRQLRSRNVLLHGGLTGSWPVSGSFKAYSLPGETVALFVTALLALEGADRAV